MFARKTPLIALLLLCLSALANAAGPKVRIEYVQIEKRLTPEQMRDTGLDTLSPAQLELLNRLLQDETVRTTEQAAAQAPPAQVSAGTASRMMIGLDDTQIRSRAKGTVTGWQPGTEFVLENGQVWKVLKGSMTLRTPLQAPEVLVVPGVAGRWFLQVDEDLPKARVYRID